MTPSHRHRPTHAGYPDVDPAPPVRVRLNGREHDADVVKAIDAVASEFPGRSPVILEIGDRELTLSRTVLRCAPLSDAIRDVVRRYSR